MIILHIFLLLGTIACQKLLMIQQTFRHGARYPYKADKEDHSDISEKEGTLGELTSEGKSMHFLLGKIVYQRYWKQLFEGTPYQKEYSQKNFYVKSTDVNRTLESAQSHLFGLLSALPPLQLDKNNYQFSLPAWDSFQNSPTNISESWNVFQSASPYHPIPIHSEKRGATFCDSGDILTKYDVQSCPRQIQWFQQNFKSDQNVRILSDSRIQQAAAALSEQIGRKIPFQQVFLWKDRDIAFQYLGMPRLNCFLNPKHTQIYNFIYVYSMYLSLYSNPEQTKAVSTPYLRQTLSNFNHSVFSLNPKIIIYSSHDTTVAMLLSAMNFTNVQCISDHYLKDIENDETCIWEYPKYSANAIFELWNKNKEFYIKFLYNGEYRKIPVCGYRYECTYGEFQNWVNQFVVDDPNQACGYVEKDNKLFWFVILAVILITILIIFSYILHKKLKTIDTIKKAKKQGYIVNFQEKITDEIKQ